jgi:ADP-ribose pyrophosphatase
MTEEIIKREPVYQGKLIRIDQLTARVSNGKEYVRDLVVHPGAVAIIPITPQNEIIFVRQYRYGANETLLEIPAGTLHAQEDPDLCAIRELQEEVGMKPGSLRKIGGVFVAPGYDSEYITLYLATDLTESRLDMDEDEFIELTRIPVAEVYKMMERGEFNDAKTVCALAMARSILKA